MKLDSLKNLAARKVGSVLASDAAMKVVSDPRVQGAMLRALNARGEVREAVEKRVSTLAAAFDLVTSDDVAGLRRTIRNLEDSVEELREELEAAQASARKASATANAAQETAAAAKAELAEARAAPAGAAPTKAAESKAAGSNATAAKDEAGEAKAPARKRGTKAAHP